jgi:iron complex outermembrane receptor protein
LSRLSFEELSQIQVTIATKRPESLNDTPAAVYVLTGDELCRSGATTLPDALRCVPGLDVAMVNSSQWAVSSRGFNGQYANQLLVMMDGRSIYNPSFGGVIWDAQDTIFEDVDRIEVVRGPGGALWGANAVNGVINILTKPADETQGLLVKAGGGSFNEAISAARYGFKLSDNTSGRVYAKYDLFGETPLSTGGYTPDDWWRVQSGFRLDSKPDEANTFTLQGDMHRVDQGAIYMFPNFTPPDYTTMRD